MRRVPALSDAWAHRLVAGQVIASLRAQNRVTQAALAAKLSVDQPAVSRLERGASELTDELQRKVAEALQLEFRELDDLIENAYKATVFAACAALERPVEESWWLYALRAADHDGLIGLVTFCVRTALRSRRTIGGETDRGRTDPLTHGE